VEVAVVIMEVVVVLEVLENQKILQVTLDSFSFRKCNFFTSFSNNLSNYSRWGWSRWYSNPSKGGSPGSNSVFSTITSTGGGGDLEEIQQMEIQEDLVQEVEVQVQVVQQQVEQEILLLQVHHKVILEEIGQVHQVQLLR
jgi:hypothetical protein